MRSYNEDHQCSSHATSFGNGFNRSVTARAEPAAERPSTTAYYERDSLRCETCLPLFTAILILSNRKGIIRPNLSEPTYRG